MIPTFSLYFLREFKFLSAHTFPTTLRRPLTKKLEELSTRTTTDREMGTAHVHVRRHAQQSSVAAVSGTLPRIQQKYFTNDFRGTKKPR